MNLLDGGLIDEVTGAHRRRGSFGIPRRALLVVGCGSCDHASADSFLQALLLELALICVHLGLIDGHRQGLVPPQRPHYRVQYRTLHDSRPADDGSPEVGDHPPVVVSLGTDEGPPAESPASITINAAA